MRFHWRSLRFLTWAPQGTTHEYMSIYIILTTQFPSAVWFTPWKNGRQAWCAGQGQTIRCRVVWWKTVPQRFTSSSPDVGVPIALARLSKSSLQTCERFTWKSVRYCMCLEWAYQSFQVPFLENFVLRTLCTCKGAMKDGNILKGHDRVALPYRDLVQLWQGSFQVPVGSLCLPPGRDHDKIGGNYSWWNSHRKIIQDTTYKEKRSN